MKSILTTIFIFLTFIGANGAVKTWNGSGGNSNLNNPANWVGGVAPVTNDDLVFPDAAIPSTVSNNYPANTTFQSVTLQGGNYTITGAAFNLTDGITSVSGNQIFNVPVTAAGAAVTFNTGFDSVVIFNNLSIGAAGLKIAGDGLTRINQLSGSGKLTKDGEGECTVVAVAAYTGSFESNNGDLIVNANASANNANGRGGNLAGTGSLGNVNIDFGVIGAGSGIFLNGILNTKNLTLSQLTLFLVDIDGNNVGAGGYDQVNVTGAVNLNDATVLAISFGGFTPTVGLPLTIINNDGTDAVVGTFRGLPEAGKLTANGITYKVSYVGGTGNDVTLTRVNNVNADFDGDSKTDISAYRPTGGLWSIKRSGNNVTATTSFGLASDLITPADFDGDKKADIAVFRPSTGIWYRLSSINNTFSATQFGASGDLPMPKDYDGDGKDEVAVFRPSQGVWYELRSLDNSVFIQQFGLSGDKPLTGDYDGDGFADIAVFRPSTNVWYYYSSSNDNFSAVSFGLAGDIPIPADFDGDGKTDYAVFRASNVAGQSDFQILLSSDATLRGFEWGIIGDIPVVGDYDGDGKADVAIYRPANNTWYLLQSTNGFSSTVFGQSGDKPVSSAFIN